MKSTARGRIFGPLLGRFLPPEIDPNVIALALEILGASTTDPISTTGEMASVLSLLGASVTGGTQTIGTAGIISLVSAATNQPTVSTDGAIASIQSFAGSSQTPALATMGSVEALSSVTAAFSGVQWVANQTYSDLTNTTEFSAKFSVTIAADSTGDLFKSGGAIFGIVVYAHAGRLYFQAGIGGETNRIYGATTAETFWDIVPGTHTIELSALVNINGSNLAIYVDGVLILIGSATFDQELGGPGAGIVLPTTGSPFHRGTNNIPFNGTLIDDTVFIYPDQSTPDVQ